MSLLAVVLRSALTLALLATLSPGVARADRRYYGETYNSSTSPPGGLDLELWSTLSQAPRAGGVQYWTHQLELETGITPRWDVALYNVWVREQGDATRYQATKIETRYRLSDYGEWFVDPVLYLELKKEWLGDKPFATELKLILSKDVGPFNVAVNGSYELELIPGGDRQHEGAYAVGASYELVPWVRVGAESFGAWARLPGGEVESGHYAGPALSLAVSRTWLVLAAGFGLTDASQRAQLRGILAFQF